MHLERQGWGGERGLKHGRDDHGAGRSQLRGGGGQTDTPSALEGTEGLTGPLRTPSRGADPPARGGGRTPPIERMRGPQAGVTPGPNPGPPCAFERSMIVDGWQFTLRYRSSLRSSSTHGPSDPPPRVVSFASVFRARWRAATASRDWGKEGVSRAGALRPSRQPRRSAGH